MKPDADYLTQPEDPISQEEYEKETIFKAIEIWDSNGDEGILPHIPQRENGYVGYDSYIVFIKVAMVVETALLLIVIAILLFR